MWLGMKRKGDKVVWFDDTPAEPPMGILYSAWNTGEPSGNGDCAFLDFHTRRWNDDKCDYINEAGPFVVCQKERKKGGS